MFDFRRKVDIKAIKELLTDYQILLFYQPELRYGKAFKSPFREERNPSFGIYMGRDGITRFNDMSTGEKGDSIDFVCKLYGLNTLEAINKISQDFGLDLAPTADNITSIPITVSRIVTEVEPHEKLKITIQYRDWNELDKQYWEEHGLTLQEVYKSRTYPISAFRIGSGTTVLADPLAYCMDFYDDGDGIMMRKIYQPRNGDMKWRTNLTPLVVDGIKEIPKAGSKLIITKSRKDRLVLKHYGYNAISTNSESTFIPDTLFEKLKTRFPTILLFFDSDIPGIKNANKLSALYGIHTIQIPEEMKVSDIAEFRKKYGEKETEQLLTKLIN